MTDCSHHPIFLLKRLHLATRKAFDEALTKHGLTAAQFEILQHVWRQDGLEQRTLQERLGITSATLTGIVDGLVDRQLLIRRPSPEDARVKQLFLTDKGLALDTQVKAVLENVQERLLEGFSLAEIALLQDWMQRMIANMGEPSQDCC
ncbi:MAG: MarR family transcriptional regulator [Chloroflexales bacterium]|nr:MarR family transcriptional regulator [Chloroflexales bacterium]